MSDVQPTKQDKAEFRTALQRAAAGHLPVRMWLFYEFLVHHGEMESNPRLDKDLFFYCEVLKFKVCLALRHSSRMRFLRSFENKKKRNFLRLLKLHFKKT